MYKTIQNFGVSLIFLNNFINQERIKLIKSDSK